MILQTRIFRLAVDEGAWQGYPMMFCMWGSNDGCNFNPTHDAMRIWLLFWLLEHIFANKQALLAPFKISWLELVRDETGCTFFQIKIMSLKRVKLAWSVMYNDGAISIGLWPKFWSSNSSSHKPSKNISPQRTCKSLKSKSSLTKRWNHSWQILWIIVPSSFVCTCLPAFDEDGMEISSN